MAELSNERHELFCREFLADLKVIPAMIRAGFAASTAKKNGYKVFARDDVQERIQELKATRNERLDNQADDVIREVSRLAFSNVAEIMDGGGDTLWVKDLKELTEAQAACIMSIEASGGTEDIPARIKVRLHPKVAALQLLMQHHGLLTKDESRGRPINFNFDLG